MSLQSSPQYTDNSIHRYERIFGTDFVSSGGLDVTRAICDSLAIAPGMRVLDVGSGLGGSAFHMCRAYGAAVTGVDILPQMVAMARQRAAAYGLPGVTFVEGDILELELPEASFDLVYSRDSLLHIEDKPALFGKLRRLLAPGGRLFISDYATGPGPFSPEFTEYAAGYYLHTPDAYGELVKAAGFQLVEARDMTASFVAILQREVASIRGAAGSEGLPQEDCDYLAKRWERKIDWCTRGEMKWVHLRAAVA